MGAELGFISPGWSLFVMPRRGSAPGTDLRAEGPQLSPIITDRQSGGHSTFNMCRKKEQESHNRLRQVNLSLLIFIICMYSYSDVGIVILIVTWLPAQNAFSVSAQFIGCQLVKRSTEAVKTNKYPDTDISFIYPVS